MTIVQSESKRNATDRMVRIPGSTASVKWSCLFTLAPGGLIFTGTLAGVGTVQRGGINERWGRGRGHDRDRVA